MFAHALDKQLRIPLYYQLKTLLLQRIRNGELKPNDRLPAEDLLADQFDVSKATVRQALNELATAGVLRRVQGLGTFVAEPRLELGPRELTSFTGEMSARGLRPSSRVVKQEVIQADGVLAEKLHVEVGSDVFLLQRLRLADSQLMGVQTAHILLALAPQIVQHDFSEGSLYDVFRYFGLLPARAHEIHYAVLIEGPEAEMLGVKEGTAGLAGERTTFLAAGQPLEFVYSLMRGDRYQIVLDLMAHPR